MRTRKICGVCVVVLVLAFMWRPDVAHATAKYNTSATLTIEVLRVMDENNNHISKPSGLLLTGYLWDDDSDAHTEGTASATKSGSSAISGDSQDMQVGDTITLEADADGEANDPWGLGKSHFNASGWMILDNNTSSDLSVIFEWHYTFDESCSVDDSDREYAIANVSLFAGHSVGTGEFVNDGYLIDTGPFNLDGPFEDPGSSDTEEVHISAGRFERMDFEVHAAGVALVLPEPGGLGLIGLAMLAVRKRRL